MPPPTTVIVIIRGSLAEHDQVTATVRGNWLGVKVQLSCPKESQFPASVCSSNLEPGAGALHEQLELSLREHVRSGRLAPGARLPSSRALAAELGISRGVVLEAYGQLVAEGYLVASQGAPTRVAAGPRAEPAPLAAGSLEPRYAYRFDPALPDLAVVPARRLAALAARGARARRRSPRSAPATRAARPSCATR